VAVGAVPVVRHEPPGRLTIPVRDEPAMSAFTPLLFVGGEGMGARLDSSCRAISRSWPLVAMHGRRADRSNSSHRSRRLPDPAFATAVPAAPPRPCKPASLAPRRPRLRGARRAACANHLALVVGMWL